MGIFRFYYKCICLAFKRQFIVIDGVAGFISIAGGAIGYFYPEKIEDMTELAWQIPIGLYFVFVAGRLTLSPYWVYKDEKIKADALEKEIEEITTSKLQIEHKEEEADYYHKAYTHTFTSQSIDVLSIDSLTDGKIRDISYDLHRISIKNLSYEEYAKDVEVEITDMEPKNTYIRKEFSIKLRFKDDKKIPFDKHQDINPRKTIFVDVIRMKLDDNRNPRFFEILTSEEKNTRFSFNCKKEKYRITITASSKNMPLVKRKFEFGCTYPDDKINLWFKPVN